MPRNGLGFGQTQKTCTRLNTETKKTKQQLNLKLRLGGLTGLDPAKTN